MRKLFDHKTPALVLGEIGLLRYLGINIEMKQSPVLYSTFSEWMRSFKGARDFSWLSLTDPLPAFIQGWSVFMNWSKTSVIKSTKSNKKTIQ